VGGNRSARSKTTRKVSRGRVRLLSPQVSGARPAAGPAWLEPSNPFRITACALVWALAGRTLSIVFFFQAQYHGEEQSAVPRN